MSRWRLEGVDRRALCGPPDPLALRALAGPLERAVLLVAEVLARRGCERSGTLVASYLRSRLDLP